MFEGDGAIPDGNGGGSNCSDATKRDYYREALIKRIALESAQAAVKQKNGEYRATLGAAKKAGVSTTAIIHALNMRFNDPHEVLIEEREKLKMLDLSGLLPGIREKLLGRLDVEEATRNEEDEMDQARALDLGAQAGRTGEPRENNPYPAGSEEYVKWWSGWRSGQAAIAAEMQPGPDWDGAPREAAAIPK